MTELIVTFLGAVDTLQPRVMADQFRASACDCDYKLGSFQSEKDPDNGGLVLAFTGFTGNKEDAESLTKATAHALDAINKNDGLSFRFVGPYAREGGLYIQGSAVGRDGYTIVATPVPKGPQARR